MKKMISALLALAIALPMLGTAPVRAAEQEPLQAYYSGAKITVDGVLKEEQWALTDSAAGMPIGLRCSRDALYIALRTTQKKLSFRVNGVDFSADLADGTATLGVAAFSDKFGTVELSVPFADLGLTYEPGRTVDFGCTVGGASYSGKAVLAGRSVVVADDFDNVAERSYAGNLGTSSAELYSQQTTGGLHFKTASVSDAGHNTSHPVRTLDKNNFDSSKGAVIEFTADFNELGIPAAEQKEYLSLVGFAVDLRGPSWQQRYGFFSDEQGNVRLSQYEVNGGPTKSVDTGVDLPAKGVKVRIVMADDRSSVVYVNGAEVASFVASGRVPSDATKNRIFLYSSTLRQGADKKKADFVLYDLLVTQQAPAALVSAPKVEDGVVQADGVLDEAAWSLNTDLGNALVGALCDSKNLYFALNTQEKSAVLQIGQCKVNCTLGSSPRIAIGYTVFGAIAGRDGSYEITVPLDMLDKATGQLDVTATVGKASKQLTLELADKVTELTDMKADSGDGQRDATAYLDRAGTVPDGILSENQWYLPYSAASKNGAAAPAASVGFLWDRQALNVGFVAYSSRKVTGVSLTVGGKTVTADLLAGKATAGEPVSAGQSTEWRIPLSALGLNGQVGESKEYELVFTGAGGQSHIRGNLTLSGRRVVLADSGADIAGKGYTVSAPTANTTWTQQGTDTRISTDLTLTGNESYQMFKALHAKLDEVSGEHTFMLDLTVDSLPNYNSTLGWRGLCYEIRLPKFQIRYCLRGDGNKNVILDILHASPLNQSSYCASMDTTIDFGQRAKLEIVVNEENIPSIYVDGKYIGSFDMLDRTEYTSTDNYPVPRIIMQVLNSARIADADGKVGGTNVTVHDLLWTKTDRDTVRGRLEAALEAISESTVLNGNDAANVKGTLKLPGKVTDSTLGVSYNVTWTAVDAVTGKPVSVIDPATGRVTPAKQGCSVALTATVGEGDMTASRVFPVLVTGTQQAKVALIRDDADPRTGKAVFGGDTWVWFDNTHNSLVYDQGSVKAFNRITLYDTDNLSRVTLDDVGVFVSDDNKTYTKLTGWQLHQEGNVYYIYNLDASARYVKVHTYHDNLDWVSHAYEDLYLDTYPSFYNRLDAIMTVEQTEDLLGAAGAFAHTGTYAAKNDTDKAVKDLAIYIPLDRLGAQAGQYRADCADFRFTQGKMLLAHYFDGKGFYVRVPAIPAKGTTDITVRWGNANARDISDAEAVFEVVYGNRALIDLTEETELANSGRAFTFPNGEIIVVAKNDNQDLVMIRSVNGGRTFTEACTVLVPRSKFDRPWGFGGYMWDEELGRLYLIAYSVKTKSDDITKADGRMALMYTEDSGYTWSEPRFLNDSLLKPFTDKDFTLENSQGRTYSLTYCDGLKLRDADGAGPNVDYVISHSFMLADGGTLAAAAIYSKDGGESWRASTGHIAMEVKAGHEMGISETGLAQLDDGSLYVVARAQEDSNHYLYQAWSYDYGETWVNVGPSKIISTNTSPVLTNYRGNDILMWAGNNSLGGNARRRLPMTLAISKDDYKSFERSLDLTFGTSYDTIIDKKDRMTQPSIFFTRDGNEAFVCWTNLHANRTVGFLIEEFDEMIYDTKGAYDDFEMSNLNNEGWLRDYTSHVTLSGEKAASGQRSMKLEDGMSTANLYAVRQVPSMKAGTVGAALYVPSGNDDEFVMELKAGYNFTYLQHTIAAFAVAPDGTVSICTDGGKQAVGKVALDSWNSYAISFDMATETGVLYLNGAKVGQMKLMMKGDRVTAVQFGTPAITPTIGSHIYVDDFYAVEGQDVLLPSRSELTFADVKLGDWHHQAVGYALDNKLMSGYNANTFGANDTLTRAQVVQVLYNKEGQPALGGLKHSFSDVPASQWYNNAVTWGSDRGVVSGYGGGVFKPDDTVTLEQVAVILWNYSGKPAIHAPAKDGSGWARNALGWCEEHGILANVPYTAVTEKATRAQTAQMLMNYLEQ